MLAVLALPAAGLLMAFAGAAGVGSIPVAVLVAVLLLAFAWPWSFPVPGGRGTSTVIAVSGIGAVAAVLFEAARRGGYPESIVPLAPCLGLVFLLAVLAQLSRRDGRRDLTLSLSVAVTGGVIAVLGAAWIPLSQAPSGRTGLVVTAFGLAGAGIVLSSLRETRDERLETLRVPLAVALSALVGLGTAVFTDDGVVTAGIGVALGLTGGIVAALVDGVFVAVRAEGLDASLIDPPEIVLSDGAVLTAPVRRRRSRGFDPDLWVLSMAVAAVLLAAAPAYVVSRILVG